MTTTKTSLQSAFYENKYEEENDASQHALGKEKYPALRQSYESSLPTQTQKQVFSLLMTPMDMMYEDRNTDIGSPPMKKAKQFAYDMNKAYYKLEKFKDPTARRFLSVFMMHHLIVDEAEPSVTHPDQSAESLECAAHVSPIVERMMEKSPILRETFDSCLATIAQYKTAQATPAAQNNREP